MKDVARSSGDRSTKKQGGEDTSMGYILHRWPWNDRERLKQLLKELPVDDKSATEPTVDNDERKLYLCTSQQKRDSSDQGRIRVSNDRLGPSVGSDFQASLIRFSPGGIPCPMSDRFLPS